MPDVSLRLPQAPLVVALDEPPDVTKAVTLCVMVVAILYFGREVLVPVTLALLLAFLLAPLVAALRRLHLGHVPSVLLALTVALAITLSIGAVIGSQIAQLSTNLPFYVVTIETKVTSVRSYTVGRLADLADRVGSQRAKAAAATGAPADPTPESAPSAPVPAASSAAPLELAQRYLSPVLSPLVTLGLVFIVSVFALLQQEDLRGRLIRLLGSDDLHQTTLGIDDGGQRLSRYFGSQLCVNAGFGLVIGVGLFLIGVPNPVLFGILSALLRFVPYLGSLLSALLPMSLAAAVDPGWSMMLWTALLYLLVEGATGQVIEPLLYAHSTGLSPFAVVVAAIFWSWLWGPVGLILSTPLTMCLVVIGQHVKRLKFLDIMLGEGPL
jgi:predicted PurR-regulated permease PerM